MGWVKLVGVRFLVFLGGWVIDGEGISFGGMADGDADHGI